MTSLRALELNLRQRLHDIHLRLEGLDPRASGEMAADIRRNDLCDSAQAIGALADQTISVDRLTLTAKRITRTLDRIANGTYGRCEECDEPIPSARLKVIPVRDPERLSDAQLRKEVEFLLRRTQHSDQADRFRLQCERLAQPAA